MDSKMKSPAAPVVKPDIRPILIDALHINMGGALMILNHLVNKLVNRSINFYLLKDARCPKLQAEDIVTNIEVLPATTSVRKAFYKTHKNDFSTILCLGNVPPPVKVDAPVHTYIHNVSLLEIPREYPLKWKILNFFKRNYIRFYAKHTDTWIVQTSHTANLVCRYLPCKNKGVLIYPFYYIPSDINRTLIDTRQDYVFIGDYTYAKGHEYLIEAWVKLAEMGFRPILHLTVASKEILPLIGQAVTKGANIINHGRINFSEVIDLYNKSKVTLYPSLNESLGLGIIEAIHAGCDVIASDLPYLHSVCVPSGVFKPRNSEDIVRAVLAYENDKHQKSILTIKDCADELIDYLTNPNFKNE